MIETLVNAVRYANRSRTVEDLIEIDMLFHDEVFILKRVTNDAEIAIEGVGNVWIVVVSVEVLK